MSLTASTMMDLGTEIPSFALPDVSSGQIVWQPEQGPKQSPILVMFISHRMDEIAEVGDRCTVMRSGETVATLERRSATADRKSVV